MSCGAQHMPIYVKIGRLNRSIKEYCLPTSTTYSDLFIKAGIGPILGNEEIVRNGVVVPLGILSSFVADKDVILLRVKARGITVRVSRIGCRLQSIEVPDSSTVKRCLDAAGIIPAADEDIWLHVDGIPTGNTVQPNYIVKHMDILVVEKRVNPTRRALINLLLEFRDAFACENCDEISMNDIPALYIDRIMSLKYSP